MGGVGSGNWYRFNTKATVEDSLTIAASDFRGRLYSGSKGTLTWRWATGAESSIGYSVTRSNSPAIVLSYRWANREDVRICIRLQSTSPNFGGARHWFTCPLTVAAVECNRRVAKLHLPPNGRYFGCRKCHNLTYQSSQEAHQCERRLDQIAWMRDRVDMLGNRKL